MPPQALISQAPLLEVNHLFFERSEKKKLTPIFCDLSFTLNRGETLAILGPSGCGKTSLLYSLAGLIKPTSGSIYFQNKALLRPEKGISVIFQNYGLLPWKSVLDNILLGVRIQNPPHASSSSVAFEMIDAMGLNGLEKRYPFQLSEGQRQRVAIARSLLLKPDLLLMDEPFSSLDSLNRLKLQELLLKIWEERLFSLIMITHNIDEAVFLGQKILVLSSSPGNVQELITNPLPLGSRFHPDYPRFTQSLQQKLITNS